MTNINDIIDYIDNGFVTFDKQAYQKYILSIIDHVLINGDDEDILSSSLLPYVTADISGNM